jgi:hypothetical protein
VSGDATDTNPSPDHVEVAALRQQVADLTAQLATLEARVTAPVATPAPVPSAAARRTGRGRTIAAVALVVVASLLVPVSITASWLRNRVVNTDGYVATVAPLARNADIQAAAGARIADALFTSTDVEATVARLLPDDAAVLAVPITSSLKALADQAIVAVLASDQFATLWDEVHRLAHAQVVSTLTGTGTTGTVAVDLAPVVKVVAEQLDASGLALFERAGNTPVLFEVLKSDDLAQLQASFRLYDRLATALPWVTLLLLAAAVVVARDRRRMLVAAAVGVALGAAALLLAVTAGRWYYLASLPAGVSLAASEAFFDTLARFLVSGARFVLTLGVVVAVAAVVAGPSASAVRLRRFATEGVGRAATEVDQRGGSGRAGAFVAANHTALRVAVAVAVAVVLVAADRPTGTMVLWLAAGSLVVLGVLDVLARTGTRTSSPEVASSLR